MNTSGTVSTRCLPWKSLMVKRPTWMALVASMWSFMRHRAAVERHGEGEALEDRAQLEDAGRHAVEPVRLQRVDRVVGVVVGQRGHGHDLAGMDVEDDAGGGDRMVAVHRLDQFVAEDVLHADVERQLDRVEPFAAREAGGVEIGEPLVVDVFLETRRCPGCRY